MFKGHYNKVKGSKLVFTMESKCHTLSNNKNFHQCSFYSFKKHFRQRPSSRYISGVIMRIK